MGARAFSILYRCHVRPRERLTVPPPEPANHVRLSIHPLRIWLQLAISRRFRVFGVSMAPTLRSGELVLVNRLTFRLRAARRHEIVVVQHPDRPDLLTIKRIVGLPGEHVRLEGGGLWIDSRPLSEPYLKWP